MYLYSILPHLGRVVEGAFSSRVPLGLARLPADLATVSQPPPLYGGNALDTRQDNTGSERSGLRAGSPFCVVHLGALCRFRR
jgi:hypothetical protein